MGLDCAKAADRLEVAGIEGAEVRSLGAEEAKEAIYALWDPHSPEVDVDQREADVADWEAGQKDAPTGAVDLVAAWYIAADTAWVEAALPSDTMSRNQFLEQWLA